MAGLENAFYGGHGIVGAQVSLGTGISFANRYRGDGKVCVTYFGDGAANQGQVYESFNMAALWKLPVVYIVENNQYAMGTAIQRSTSETHLHKRGISFNIPGEEVDGMDVLAVREAGLGAVDHARSGAGPILLEMKTYRYRGHSMSDPAKYRTKEEVEEMKTRHDPIEQVKKLIIDAGHADDEALREIDREIPQARIVQGARAESPSVLLLNDKHDLNWQVLVDGKPAPLLRCNYLMRGVFLEPGEHMVEFQFRPPVDALYVSLGALALGLVLVGLAVADGRRRPASATAPRGNPA